MIKQISRRLACYYSLGPRYWRWRALAALGSRDLRAKAYLEHFGGRGLEIGGPSDIFAAGGPLPVYATAASIDNVTYSELTHWEGEVRHGRTFRFNQAREPGNQYVMEAGATDSLLPIEYDFIISSHMLEHVANPVSVLRGWQKVLRADGHLLLVLPHRDGTFDHRRPVTKLAHLLEDAERGVGEDDQTHLAEILELHDLSRDPSQSSRAEFERWIARNSVTRGAHHHVFDAHAGAQLLDAVGLHLVDVEPAMPHHVVLLSRKPGAGGRPDNSRFLDRSAGCYRSSPFASDRCPS